jgi:uncharacterized delta-60 repeat protein
VGAEPITVSPGVDQGTFTVVALGSADHAGPVPVTVSARATEEGEDLSAELELPAYVAGQPGQPDTSFSFDGEVLFSVTEGPDAVSSASLDPEGRLLVTGVRQGETLDDLWAGWVVRLLPDGSLDESFASSGKLVGFGGEESNGFDVLPAPDGGVLLLATSRSGETLTYFIRKLSADGSPDTSYGTGGDIELPSEVGRMIPRGNGIVAYGAGQILAFDESGRSDDSFEDPGLELSPTRGAADREGRLVLGTWIAEGDLMVVRLTVSGGLDSSFGDGGYATFPGPDENVFGKVLAIALAPDGGGLLVGTSEWGAYWEAEAAIVRFGPDGASMSAFGPAGKRIFDDQGWASLAALEPTGKVLVVGAHVASEISVERRLARYNPDGQLDTSFGEAGIRLLPNMEEVRLLCDQEAGRATVVGRQPGGGLVARRFWL